jgi:NAD(P)-dependent dehydrogenase (short-subunit alcohol dehydrogenase family)
MLFGAAWLARTSVRRSRYMDLAGCIVWITGAPHGLGPTLARLLVREGARVAISGHDQSALETTRALVAREGGDVTIVRCDLGDQTGVEHAAGVIQETLGEVDVLINNAGVVDAGHTLAASIGDYERAMRAHFWGPLYAMHAVLPGMRERRTGRIVNVVSIGELRSVPHLLPHSTSRSALIALSEGWRPELARAGIYITTVSPGIPGTGEGGDAHRGKAPRGTVWFRSTRAPSMGADRAAGQIVRACQAGRPHLVLSLPEKARNLLHRLAPGATAELTSLVDRGRPRTTDHSRRAMPGRRWLLQPWLPQRWQRERARPERE